nr:odorant binding protein 27 [Graphosoma rubrolineatum]
MLYSTFVLAIVLLAAHSVSSDKFSDIVAACSKETGFTGDFKKVLDFKDPDISKEAKCTLGCILDKKGSFKPDGSIDVEKEKTLPEEIGKDEEKKKKILKGIEKCDPSAKANKCETAYEFMKCMKLSLE